MGRWFYRGATASRVETQRKQNKRSSAYQLNLFFRSKKKLNLFFFLSFFAVDIPAEPRTSVMSKLASFRAYLLTIDVK